MQLTKRQEKQLLKAFDDPKKLRKWVDEVYQEMINRCIDQTKETVDKYINIYSITVAYTLRYVCGFGKKRLPEVMKRIWNNLDCFTSGHLSLDDCISELEEYGIEFTNILRYPGQIKGDKYDNK